MENYWNNKTISKNVFFSRLKQISWIAWFFSVRSNDEFFLSSELSKDDYVLDVACGAGKSVLADKSQAVIGVDIKGFPADVAKKRGYIDAIEYHDNYKIPTQYKFDKVTFININAHIPFQALDNLIDESLKHSKEKCKLIFINEYDNDSIIFRLMKKNTLKYNHYVNWCGHINFHRELDFIRHMSKRDDVILTRREILSANPAFMHFFAAKGISNLKILSFFADIIISIYNNLVANNEESGFIVAHVFMKKTLTESPIL